MRRLLVSMGIAMAALEAVNTPMLGEMWPLAAAFAVMFAGLTWWFAKTGAAVPIVILGILFLIEVVMVPGYERTSAVDWIMQGLAGVLSLLGLVAAVGVLLSKRQSTRSHGEVKTSSA